MKLKIVIPKTIHSPHICGILGDLSGPQQKSVWRVINPLPNQLHLLVQSVGAHFSLH